MRSLQIVTPHIPCEYNCPFCIAKAHKHDNEFKNAYNGDFEFWRDSLAKVLMENEDLKFVVITGTNEPMQTPDCVEDIIKLVRYYRSDISIEIQTRDYRESPLYNEMDTVCYSISNRYYLDRISIFYINQPKRLSFILLHKCYRIKLISDLIIYYI